MREVQAWTFPAGKLIHKTVTATAGNVAFNLSPTAGKRWKVIGGRIRLVADGNPANRLIGLLITDGTNEIRHIGATSAITASQTRDLDFGEGREAKNAGLGNPSYGQFYLGFDPAIIEGSDQFRITINAGLAGDSYEGNVTVLEIDI